MNLEPGHYFFTGMDSVMGGREIIIIKSIIDAENRLYECCIYSSDAEFNLQHFKTVKRRADELYQGSTCLGRFNKNVVGAPTLTGRDVVSYIS